CMLFFFKTKCGRCGMLSPVVSCKLLPSGSGGFVSGDLMGDRAVHVEGADHGFGIEEVPKRFIDLRVLLAMILFGVSSFVPETQSQNVIGFRVRDEHNLVHEALLFFQDWYRSFIDGFCQFFRFSRLAGQFNCASKHSCSFRWLESERNPPRARRRQCTSCGVGERSASPAPGASDSH